MTEIYEYACSLNDEQFSIIEFQVRKKISFIFICFCVFVLIKSLFS